VWLLLTPAAAPLDARGFRWSRFGESEERFRDQEWRDG
jgi:hypothetical protein